MLSGESDISGLWRERLAEFFAVIFEELAIAREHGPVDHPVAEVEEEGFLAIGLYELEGFFGEFVVGIRDSLWKVF